MAKEKFGTDTPLYNKSFYNSRGQLSEIRVGLTPTGGSWQRGAIINHYSAQCWGACNGTDNNGNLKSQDHWIQDASGGVQAIFTQSFAYDNLNRLLRANEGSNWQQEFVYDRWGNRTIHQTNSWGTGINKKDFTVNTANNRLGVPSGQPGVMSYDAAGNLTNDTYTGAGSRVYDAENRMTKAWGGNNQWQEYTYNADGQRVRRKINGVETRQIYGMDGDLLAEYAADAAPAIPQKEYGYRNGQMLVTASNLKGYWNFDENTGTTAADSAGNGNTGTLTSGAGWTSGQSGAAINLDGVNDYVQVGAQSSLIISSTAGFSTWIYPTGSGSDATYGGIIVNKEGEYEIARTPNGTIQWAFANSNPGWNWISTGVVAPLNQWSHIAVTYDNGTIKTYFNGNLAHTYNGSGSIGDAIPSQNDFRIGGRQASAQYFQGRIDEVRVYNRALTGSEVSSLLNGGLIAPNINWLVADQLGTPRIILDKTGSLATTKRHDYLPFGEELFAGVGGRTASLGYKADAIRQKFTSYERDSETEMDFAQARYYSSGQGRFTSVDPLLASVRRTNPQSWNRYSYVSNEPLRLIDPTGMRGECTPTTPCQIVSEAQAAVDDPKNAVIRENVDVDITQPATTSTPSVTPSLMLQEPVPQPPPTPTPSGEPQPSSPSDGGFGRLLPNFFGLGYGAQGGIVAGGNGMFATGSKYFGHFPSNPSWIHSGTSSGGFIGPTLHSGGIYGGASFGGFLMLSNAAHEGELEGNGQSVIGDLFGWGVEFQYSRNQQNQLVYSLNIGGGVGLGGGIVTLPTKTVANPIVVVP